MELKEAISKLKELSPTLIYLGDKQALQTAISHLETLQKVKDMGGVKKKNYKYDSTVDEYAKIGFNDAIDLKDAELAGKLEGLKDIIVNSSMAKALGDKYVKNHNGAEFGILVWDKAINDLTNKIQELILGKKEG